MGDSAAIHLKYRGGHSLTLYTHWEGHRTPAAVKLGLQEVISPTGDDKMYGSRLDDPMYGTRLFLKGLGKSWLSGLEPGVIDCSDGHPAIHVDWDRRKVIVEGCESFTFTEYLAINRPTWAKLGAEE